MTTEFNVHNAAGYQQLMGRWSPIHRLHRGFRRRKDSRRRLRHRELDLRAR